MVADLQNSEGMSFNQFHAFIPSGSCVSCGSLFLQQGLICSFCLNHIYLQSEEGSFGSKEHFPISGELVSHRWVVCWHNRQDRWISRWAHLLKGNTHQKTWQTQAAAYCRQHGQSFLEDAVLTSLKPLILIGPEQKMDHSYFWGKALADELSLQHLPYLFTKSNSAVQKRQGLAVRRLQTFHIQSDYKNFISDEKDNWHWVFADDVWTSGATANAAFLALGRPKFFQVMSFFRRFL